MKKPPTLLLIDIQNDYFPGGKMELFEMEESATNAKSVLDFFRIQSWPVIHIQHLSIRHSASFFLPGTRGAEIHQLVAPLAGETVITKNFPNSFRQTKLLNHLQNGTSADELIIVGSMVHMCLESTVRSAFDLDFKCTVIQDACATKDLMLDGKRIKAQDIHQSFMAAFQPIFAEVLTADQFLTINHHHQKHQAIQYERNV